MQLQNKTVQKPIYDGYDRLVDLIAWVVEPTEQADRAARLKELCTKHIGFGIFIHYAFISKDQFTDLLVEMPKVIYRNTGQAFGLNFAKTMADLHYYVDGGVMPLANKCAQFTEAMDFTIPEDRDVILKMMAREKCLPDKLNKELLLIAFPELWE